MTLGSMNRFLLSTDFTVILLEHSWLTCDGMIFKEITTFRGTVINYILTSAWKKNVNILFGPSLVSFYHPFWWFSKSMRSGILRANTGAYKFLEWWDSIQETEIFLMAEDWLEPTFEGLLMSVHLSQQIHPAPFFFSWGNILLVCGIL